MSMRAKRGANFAQNAIPFFVFMVGGSYGISVLLQGRNDVRDAKADVTDMRAMPQTQRVRSKNRAFSLDEENEKTLEALGGVGKHVEMIPVPRPWEEPGAKRRRFLRRVRGWWSGNG
mmetsp:Transcript_3354/g.12469  ORF Transcript_3354/g.12469 Transcript_3354/m.12469 type:complete len:117 (+) Transcript_3354:26-376(+)